MKNSKVLKVVLTSALVASVAATASMSVFASEAGKDYVQGHKVGVTGSFNGWAEDVELTDEDGDGVYEGIVDIAEVTADMITPWSVDDELTSESYLQFKVRLDGSWTDSWGNYEPLHDRVYNSQSNVPVKEAVAGQPLKFKAIFNTVKVNPDALANPDSYAEEGDFSYDGYLTISYEIIKDEAPAPESSAPEESSEAPVDTTGTTSETPADTTTSTVSEAPATVTSTDTTTVPTGDATSAAALAAVVVASLGVAVVMTKKASSKD